MTAILQPGFWVFILTMSGIYGIFTLGLQVQYGVGGILNFGHVGMMALSSYTMAILVIAHGFNFWIAAASGVAVAALGGAFLGLTTLRLRGDYFSIVSIAFSEIVRYVIFNSDGLTGGAQGSLAIMPIGDAYPSYTDTWDTILYWIRDHLTPILAKLQIAIWQWEYWSGSHWAFCYLLFRESNALHGRGYFAQLVKMTMCHQRLVKTCSASVCKQ